MEKLKSSSNQKTGNRAPLLVRLKRWQVPIAAFISISILVLINVTIIFKEDWAMAGFPHHYVYTALQKYYSSIVSVKGLDYYNSVWDLRLDDNLLSPLYQLSTLFAHLGEPSPPWFRLAGVVLLVLIFIVSYFLWPSPTSSTDRLLVAMTVATTPAVFFVTRYLEDHGLHMLILLIGTATLLHSHMGRTTFKAMPFYILPALDLFLTHTITNFLITMMSFAGIYIYLLFTRIKGARLASVIKTEIPRLIFAIVFLIIVSNIRLPCKITAFFKYYSIEAAGPEMSQISWVKHLLAYPEVLLFSAAGVILCSLALLNISWRLRGSNVWMFLLWILIPLVVLTPITKKNTYYVWVLAPAVALLAAGAVSKFSLKLKKVWIVACFVLAALHAFHFVSPLEDMIDTRPFQVRFLMNDYSCFKEARQKNIEVAKEALMAAQKCGPLDNRPLVVVKSSFMFPMELYYTMLYLDQRPIYWPIVSAGASELSDAVVVEVRTNTRLATEIEVFWFLKLVGKYRELIRTRRLVYESPDYKVYCP